MNIVITGGAGFIGSHLCDYFVKRGDKVICIDNLITGSLKNITPFKKNPNFHFIQHDVTKFIDIETGEELITQPWEIKKMYLRKMEEMKKFFSSKCHNSYIDYVPINTSTPYDKALFAYLIKRQKLL